MKLPDGWDAEPSNDPSTNLVHLVHTPCGFRTSAGCDLRSTTGPFGSVVAAALVYGHRCDGEGE